MYFIIDGDYGGRDWVFELSIFWCCVSTLLIRKPIPVPIYINCMHVRPESGDFGISLQDMK